MFRDESDPRPGDGQKNIGTTFFDHRAGASEQILRIQTMAFVYEA